MYDQHRARLSSEPHGIENENMETLRPLYLQNETQLQTPLAALAEGSYCARSPMEQDDRLSRHPNSVCCMIFMIRRGLCCEGLYRTPPSRDVPEKRRIAAGQGATSDLNEFFCKAQHPTQ